jgi:predicted RNA-binding protein YlqC (UPF0109 family)
MALVDTSDIERFAAKLGRMPETVRNAIRDANIKTANEMLRRGKIIIPKSPHAPHLAQSLTVSAGDPRLLEQVVSVGSEALEYAVPLEFGHKAADGSHVPAQPWFIPLTRVFRKKHKGRMRRAIRKALREAF